MFCNCKICQFVKKVEIFAPQNKHKNMKTKVTFADPRRVIVETPQGDDFVIIFQNETNYQIEQQSVFKITRDLGLLFDYFYRGDTNVIMGEISRQLMLHGYNSIFGLEHYKKEEKDEERIRIGKRIKEIRSERGYDAKTLACLTGIDAANLCRIEAGKYSVGFDTLTKIAKVCGKKLDFVNTDDENECTVNLCLQ